MEIIVNMEGVKGVKKITKSQHSWSVDRDSNPGLPEYEQD
jgi:hypothetical protein